MKKHKDGSDTKKKGLFGSGLDLLFKKDSKGSKDKGSEDESGDEKKWKPFEKLKRDKKKEGNIFLWKKLPMTQHFNIRKFNFSQFLLSGDLTRFWYTFVLTRSSQQFFAWVKEILRPFKDFLSEILKKRFFEAS